MTDNGTTNILFAGVGGQGIVLASGLLAGICLQAGYDVKQSEVHGMAQRGGSVTSHVRFGKAVHSPTIAAGEADYLLAFEILEGMRSCDQLAADGVALINTQQIEPMTVTSGTMDYPEDLAGSLRSRCPNLALIDAFDIAGKAGSVRATNMVLLGSLSARLDFDHELWRKAIAGRVPPKTLEVNWNAFEEGRKH